MSEYTLWTCPRDEWNTMLDEIMQDIGRGEVSAIVEEALKQFRDEFKRRLNMTPIEKAAEEISDLSYELMKVANLPMNAKEIADIIRRRLEKEGLRDISSSNMWRRRATAAERALLDAHNRLCSPDNCVLDGVNCTGGLTDEEETEA